MPPSKPIGTMGDWSGTPRQISELDTWTAGDPESTWWYRGVVFFGLGLLIGAALVRGL